MREGLENCRAAERTIPPINSDTAGEIRDVLRTINKEQREHALMATTDADVASAVLNAPCGGLRVEVRDNVLTQVRRTYNERHRRVLMKQIVDAEATLRRTPAAHAGLPVAIIGAQKRKRNGNYLPKTI